MDELSPLFLSVPDAAKLLGVSAERLARAIKAGQVRAITLGCRKMVARAAIERLAEMVKGDAA